MPRMALRKDRHPDRADCMEPEVWAEIGRLRSLNAELDEANKKLIPVGGARSRTHVCARWLWTAAWLVCGLQLPG